MSTTDNNTTNHCSDDGKHFVILTSHGRTATVWLSIALNHHPDFVCSHSNFTFSSPELLPNRLDLDSVSHLKGHASTLSIDDYFEAHLSVADVPNYVSVHNYQITSIRNQLDTCKHNYQLVNIIRHPVTRFRSYMNYIIKEASQKTNNKNHWLKQLENPYPQSLIKFVNTSYDVDFSAYENIAFITSMTTLLVETDELLGDFFHVPVERLLNDGQYFSWFLNHISKSPCHVSPAFLKTIYGLGRQNHNRDVDPLPVEDFATLKEWQMAVWRKIDHDRNLSELYSPYGYDLSFIQETDFSWLNANAPG